MHPPLSEDLVVLAGAVLHRQVETARRGTATGARGSDRLRLSAGEALDPRASYETAGGDLTLRVTCFDLVGAQLSEPTGLLIGGREVPCVTPDPHDSPHQVLPPLRFDGGQVAHVLVHGDSSASMRLIRALRYYDDTGRPLAPTRQMRMLDDHPGVLAVLPTSGTFSVRLEIE